MHNPIVSVLMSVYNESLHGIRRAIDSILAQSFSDFEFIIIIDNPNHAEAIELISDYAQKDSRIKVKVHNQNMGISYGCNEAILMAKAKYIARQEPDDYSYPNRIQLQFEYMEANPNVDALGATLQYVDVDRKIYFEISNAPAVGKEIKWRSPIAHPTLFARREAFLNYGFYLEGEWEYELWIRWYLKGVIMHNLKPCVYDYYQTFEDKKRKVKSYLFDAVKWRSKFSSELEFEFKDYVKLYFDNFLLLFPRLILINLVYFRYRLKSKR